MPGIGIGISMAFSGGGIWSPLTLSPLLWVRADKGITLNGSNVSAWADQSGNGNHFSEGNPAYQPAYTSGADPYVELSLNLQMNTTNALDLTGGYSLLAVIEWVAPLVDWKYALCGGGATRLQLQSNSTSATYYSHSAAGVSRPNAAAVAVVDADYDGTNTIRERINGGAYATVATAADPTTATLGLGYTGYSAAVKWRELAIFTPKLSAADQAKLTAYARGRYGV